MLVPEGSEEIEADGYILMPGLINAHTHGHAVALEKDWVIGGL